MKSTVLTTVHVSRLQPGTTSVEAYNLINTYLPLDQPLAQLATILQPLIDEKISPESFQIYPGGPSSILTVTKGPSTFSKDLKINIDQPFAEYYRNYRRYHGQSLPPKTNSESHVEKGDGPPSRSNNTVILGPARFNFNRTLRVPDNATRYALPPGLGTFPIANVQDHADALPQQITKRGGYIMPLYQREALWISIGGEHCAIKVSVGGINAITGTKRDEKPPNNLQDYVVGGKQPWLDGIATEPGVVRQFVAMKLGHGYTVEEQLSDTRIGGIQIDVFPLLSDVVTFRTNFETTIERLDLSPRELNFGHKDSFIMTSTEFPIKSLRHMLQCASGKPVLEVVYRDRSKFPQVFVRTLLGKTITVEADLDETVWEFKVKIAVTQHIPPEEQRLLFRGKQLEDHETLDYCGIETQSTLHLALRLRGGGPTEKGETVRMGIVAGGKITQKIYQDTFSSVVYDEANAYRVFIHTVSSVAWEMITGVVCPVTPITPALYKACNYPWFKLYDEHLRTVHREGAFRTVRSIGMLDDATPPPYTFLDPRSPGKCNRHVSSPAACVARPCGHIACAQCFGETVLAGFRCTFCKEKVERFIGFTEPIPKIKPAGDGEAAWWEQEAQIGGVSSGSPDVVTLILEEDSVCGLHGCV
ncbi:hypothetical protein R3P38DRAFT_3052767 [Favolaschia claudopus]|uniref:Ubiquitin-like domain-containing protein n=1 Tax=Favolaschia claudopus TaxID=2862362 RepID=A0AAW0A4J8_9AGAR